MIHSLNSRSFWVWVCLLASANLSLLPAFAGSTSKLATGKQTLSISQGELTLSFDQESMRAMHWRFAAGSGVEQGDNGLTFTLPVRLDSTIAIAPANTDQRSTAGMSRVNGTSRVTGEIEIGDAIVLDADGLRVLLAKLRLQSNANGLWSIQPAAPKGEPTYLVAPLSVSVLDIGEGTWRVLAAGEVRMTNAWAAKLGVPEWGGETIGSLILDVTATAVGEAELGGGKAAPTKQADAQGAVSGSIGPDAMPTDFFSFNQYPRDAATGINAYSFGTAVCNVGDAPVGWNGQTPLHPVIAQNFYRLKEGTFEQIGMSWVKHGVGVEAPSACGGDFCQPSADTLGPNCRDTYFKNLNGFQANLGPRWEINATTGVFPFPFGVGGLPSYDTPQDRRMQIHDSDLEPSQNPTALYFMESQYVMPDDGAAGNQANNAGYRRANVEPRAFDPGFDLFIDFPSDPVAGEPAIMAWGMEDATVETSIVDIPGDGRFILANKATDLGNGEWQYEYALHNLYSDRSGQSFTVPFPQGANVTNIGFHDVDSHSGSPISNIDWTPALLGESVSWATETFDANPNANAIRWGTLYNFRFQADVPPVQGCVTVGLFKPGLVGAPNSFEASALVPLAVTLEESDPPNGAIDARQPFEINDTTPLGWQEVTFTFSACASAMVAADFDVSQEGGVLPVPTVMQVEQLGGNAVTVRLSRPIEPRAWTTISHVSGASVRLGSLPGDVDADGTTNPALDLTAMIDCLNQPGTCDAWQTDIDRDGTPGVLDITRLIDLMNGAGLFESFIGAQLP